MEIHRTDEEINTQIDKAQDQINEGSSKYKGMTYEEGVRAAIDWIVGNDESEPMSD